jgi:hypothetical protein
MILFNWGLFGFFGLLILSIARRWLSASYPVLKCYVCGLACKRRAESEIRHFHQECFDRACKEYDHCEFCGGSLRPFVDLSVEKWERFINGNFIPVYLHSGCKLNWINSPISWKKKKSSSQP